MPGLRRYLHWIAIAILAGFAPVFALAIYVAERIRVAGTGRVLPEAVPASTIVAFVPRPRAPEKTGPAPVEGAVVIPFPGRHAAILPPADPPALTG